MKLMYVDKYGQSMEMETEDQNTFEIPCNTVLKKPPVSCTLKKVVYKLQIENTEIRKLRIKRKELMNILISIAQCYLMTHLILKTGI